MWCTQGSLSLKVPLSKAAASEILWNDLMVHLLIYQVSVDLDTSGKMLISSLFSCVHIN